MEKTKELEIKDIVAWMSGYISVIEGHERLKEEMLKLESLVLKDKSNYLEKSWNERVKEHLQKNNV
jgi:hypothetical protein